VGVPISALRYPLSPVCPLHQTFVFSPITKCYRAGFPISAFGTGLDAIQRPLASEIDTVAATGHAERQSTSTDESPKTE